MSIDEIFTAHPPPVGHFAKRTVALGGNRGRRWAYAIAVESASPERAARDAYDRAVGEPGRYRSTEE